MHKWWCQVPSEDSWQYLEATAVMKRLAYPWEHKCGKNGPASKTFQGKQPLDVVLY